jgi:2,3-dihydroxybenzoate decarboxylase
VALCATHSDAQTRKGKRDYLRIACEESFSTREVVAELSRLANGVPSMKSGPIKGPFMNDLLDMGEGRVRGMDADGVDIQVLSLTSPGVQLFARHAVHRAMNDLMADTIRKYPGRFGGLATIAPQAPNETIRNSSAASTP